tara:strand:+ start:579 stop:1067 length:489 start_codon:yes stop_codon:yes gene_type:complete
MSLWGMKDKKVASTVGTIAVTVDTGAVAGAASVVLTDFAVGDHLDVGQNDYVFTAIASDTVATVRAAINGGALPGATANAAYIVSEKPLSITYSEAGGDPSLVFGADTTEVGVAGEGKKVGHAGWVKRTAGTSGRSGRVHYETLVAASSISGDAENTVLPQS